MSQSEHQRIFGDREAVASGSYRFCKVCGGWHSLSAPWPHNCRKEAPPRARNLAAPRLAPRFEEFVAGTQENPVAISDPSAKRDYMARHDLVEYDAGVKPPPEPSEREWMAEFVEDFNRAEQQDPLNRPPTEIIGRADLEGAPEINPATIEVSR